MTNSKVCFNLFRKFKYIMILVVVTILFPTNVRAAEATDCLTSLTAGAAVALDADITLDNETLHQVAEEATAVAAAYKKEKKSTLVMANVDVSLNVRAEANEDSQKVGVLYKDCGGKIVEQKAGWTKLKSGNLEGWAKNEYLLFDEEAEGLAEEVGNLVAKVNTNALSVRKSANDTAEIYGMLTTNDEVIALDEESEWISVDFDGEIGYISAEYATVDFKIDAGETMQTIQEREKKAAAEKLKLTQNRGAVPGNVSDLALLAALIQCEAGGESYEGQLAVGAVVMNRLRSGAYPNNLSGVIYASGQFTPALNGKVARVAEKGAKASCFQAATEAMNGSSNVGAATHFKRVGAHDGYVIGNHVFW